ncbi:putative glutathione S-transferase [Arachis hypogaea]|nr:putative glutathione S-transferase [Arachis hypogaea]
MGSKDVKLVSYWVSPFGKRAEWALKLKGVEYDYIEEDIYNKSDLLLELNPVHKKVPVLVHGNKAIAESFVILEYIDETWKQYPLMPHDPYQRAHARFWAISAEQKVGEGSWIALIKSGEEKEKALDTASEVLEKIEEEIKVKDEKGIIEVKWQTWSKTMERREDVKLFNFHASPFGQRVIWALKLKGVDYECIEEDIFNKSNLLLELNPVHKKVPVLVHCNKPIAESLVILEYIDETWKQYPLMPQNPCQRAHARFWANFAEHKLLDAAWMAMRSSGEEQEKAVNEAREAVEKLEEEIKGKRFFGRDYIGFLDIAIGWISYWIPVWEEVGSMKILDPLKFPAINAWITNFLSHPTINDTLPQRDKMVVYYHSRRKEVSPF